MSCAGSLNSQQWISIVDIMTQGVASKRVHDHYGLTALITVQVLKAKHGWTVTMLPGCKLVNRTSAQLNISVTHLPRNIAFTSNTGPQQSSQDEERRRATSDPARDSEMSESMSLGPTRTGSGLHYCSVYSATQQGGSSSAMSMLRVWLGRGNGWSNPLSLSSDIPQVAVLPCIACCTVVVWPS